MENSPSTNPHNMGRFTIRIYGIMIDDQRRVLVSDEFIRGMYITKFPGGGLELGEGTRDCLKREFMEETGLDVTIGEHLYTTDYFQPSAFRNNEQIISIYYIVHAIDAINLKTKEVLFDFAPEQISNPQGESEVFRWIPLASLKEEDVTLPIDKIVIKMIKEKYL